MKDRRSTFGIEQVKVVRRRRLAVGPALGSGSGGGRSDLLLGIGFLASGAANERAGKPLYGAGQAEWFGYGSKWMA